MGIIFEIDDIEADITIELAPKGDDRLEIRMITPKNDYGGGIVNISIEDLESTISFIKQLNDKKTR